MSAPRFQMCQLCDEPTGRTTEDQLELVCEKGPNLVVCVECYDDAVADEFPAPPTAEGD